MGLRRLSLKRCFLYLFCATGMLLVVMNVRQKEIWHATRSDTGQGQSVKPVSDSTKMIKVTLPPKPKAQRPTIVTRYWEHEQQRLPSETSNGTGTMNVLEGIGDVADPSRRPWYMKGGTRRPHPAVRSRRTGNRIAILWPEEDRYDDRITNQLMFVPPDYNRTSAEQRPKRIMIPHGMGEAKTGSEIFRQLRCPVDTCVITRDNPDVADLILFKDYVTHVGRRPPNQVWMLYFLECPYHTQSVKNAVVNWTATYRRDSDIVAPYERWQYYDQRVTQIPQTFNYAANKTKKVAWFVSNCHPRNQRMNYARELAKHIQVDIYGACGNLHCSRTQAHCFEILDDDYKFYLAFENSNCRDYITEKFFVNGLGGMAINVEEIVKKLEQNGTGNFLSIIRDRHNVLPIVMGAHPTDYEKSAPYGSYIHVDEFESPAELAQYLHRLDTNDELYNSYFKWKGTGQFINTYFWCRVCSMLHDEHQSKYYTDVNEWWRGEKVCTPNSWREQKIKSSDYNNV